ncbi:MAG TPA: class I tRNA ligase family protein, partial [Treponemataceae bacterium]|nr:class I tRNA ligase family protein [Treponemataceae bacterium]
CDWYVEATKLSFRNGTDEEKDRAVSVLMNILEESLRLLHPYLPFVTEEIYQKLPLKEIAQNRAKAASANSCIKGNPSSITSASEYTGMLIAAPYPAANENRINETVSNRFAVLQELIRSIRALRAECGISPDLKIDIALLLTPDAHSQVCREKEELIMLLSGVKTLSFISAKPQGAIGTVGTGFEAFLLASEGIDSAQLKARFQKEIANESAFIQKVESKLSGKFAENAPAEVVEAEKEKLKAAQRRVEKLNSYIENL